MAEKSIAEILDACTERCRNMDGPLAMRLQAFADEVRAMSAEFGAVVDRMVARLKAAGTGEKAPKPGEPMPEFMLPDQNGRLVTLAEIIVSGPVAIAFHRGHWCPYCRINASALRDIHPAVKSLGGELVAITPEMERFNAELASSVGAEFPVLSDMDNGYALLLNIAFFVNEEKQRAMVSAGWNVVPSQGNELWTLPVPATFIVGQDGLVKERFIDPDYRKRMDTDAILTAIKSARNERRDSTRRL